MSYDFDQENEYLKTQVAELVRQNSMLKRAARGLMNYKPHSPEWAEARALARRIVPCGCTETTETKLKVTNSEGGSDER